MTIDPQIEARLKSIFEGPLILDRVDGCLWIRTDYWMIEHDQLAALCDFGLILHSITTEGDSRITLIITKESSKKAFNKLSYERI